MSVSLGDRELDIMSALWREGPGTVADVRARLPVPLAYNTVLTILRNLEQKGVVSHTAEGRVHRYAPVLAEATVRRSQLARLVDKVFRGSAVGLLTHLVEHEDLSREELRDLHRLLDERLRAGEGRRRRAK